VQGPCRAAQGCLAETGQGDGSDARGKAQQKSTRDQLNQQPRKEKEN